MTKFKFEAEIDASNPQHVLALNAFLSSISNMPKPAEEVHNKEEPTKTLSKAKRLTKKQEDPEEKAPEEKAPEEKAPEEKAPEEKAPEEKAPKDISLTELRAILSTKVNEHRSEIKNKLTEFGASSLSTLESSHYQAFADFLNSL